MPDHLSVCLTFDFDAMSLWLGTFDQDTPSVLSRGEFGAVGCARILDRLAKRRIPATFYVPGHTALAYPDLVRRIVAEGHELGHHGWVHENPATLTESEERAVLARGFEVLDQVTGVRPTGYRSPAWDLSAHTLPLLLEAGFAYESSCMGHDFRPYYLRLGDVPSRTEPFIFGQEVDLVELPVAWHLDDFPLFEYVPGRLRGLVPPSHVEELWREEFAFAREEEPGGVFVLTMHPQVTGRGHRLRMLDRLLDHMAEHGARFERMADVATRWRAQHPLGSS